MNTVRQEDGWHHYSVLREDRSRGLVSVTEIWKDDSAVSKHLAQPWIKDLFARVIPLINSTDALTYDVVRTLERKV